MDELEKMQEDVFGKVGDPVPAVDPDELLRVWRVSEDIRARHGNRQIAIGQGAYGPSSPILRRSAIAPWFCGQCDISARTPSWYARD